MSKEKKMNVSLVPEYAEKALENVLEEPSKAIGSTLNDIWFLTLGGPIEQLANKRKIKYAFDLENYKKMIEQEIEKVPEDRRTIPDIQKIAALLEASKFCIDKVELREMFSKLIGATMNKDTEKYVNISFGQILSQLVPDEAKILMQLPEKSLFEPLIDICVEKPDIEGKFTLYTNLGVLGYDSSCEYPEQLSLYVDNLLRLGVVNVPNGQYLVDDWRYAKILDSMYYQKFYEKAESYGKVYIIYKMIGVTELGDALRKLCM